MKVRIHLFGRDQNSNSKDLFFDIIPHQTPIAKKWCGELANILQLKLPLEKNFCWVGFPDNPRQLPYLCESLNFYIEQVNAFSKSGGWENPYYIKERYFPEKVIVNGVLNQSLMNSIHHHFEVLQGQVWNLSPWFLKATDEVRYAIRQLNNLCHEIEILTNAKNMQQINPEQVSPALIASFLNAPRFELAPEDYDHFTLDRGFGKVFMHYCQTGKIHWEAFVDNDAEIDRTNINGLRYYSGEFNIEWGPTYNESHDWYVAKKEFYKEWLKRNDYDPDNKFLSHGWLEIGKVDVEHLFALVGSRKISDVHQLLSKNLDISRIEVITDAGLASNTFPSHWADEKFHSQQLDTLSEAYQSLPQNSGKSSLK